MVERENHIDLRVQMVHLYTSLKILKCVICSMIPHHPVVLLIVKGVSMENL